MHCLFLIRNLSIQKYKGIFLNTFSETIQITIQCTLKILCLYMFHGVFSSQFLCMRFVEFFESLSTVLIKRGKFSALSSNVFYISSFFSSPEIPIRHNQATWICSKAPCCSYHYYYYFLGFITRNLVSTAMVSFLCNV